MRENQADTPSLSGVVLVLTLTLAAVGAAGCGAVTDSAQPQGSRATAPSSQPGTSAGRPSSVGPPAESEVPADWDQQPDTPVTPVGELTQPEKDELLRVTATGPSGGDSCDADDVTYDLVGLDAAAGSRYSTLVVTNSLAAPCSVSGYPGLGARGAWGHKFMLVTEQTPVAGGPDTTPMITLAPGGSAVTTLMWSGDLAARGTEPLAALVLQLAQGQPARPVVVTAVDGHDLDIGMFTTVRIGPLQPPV